MSLFLYNVVKEWSNLIVFNVAVQFSQHHLLKRLFSLLHILADFLRDWLTIGVWDYFWALYSVPLIYVSVFVPVPHCFHYCSFVVYVVWSLEELYLQLFFSPLKTALAIQGLLCLPTNFKIFFSCSVENAKGILIGIALNL